MAHHEDQIRTKAQVSSFISQIGQLETKVDNVDDYVVLSWLPWKFIGHGYQGSYSDFVSKYTATLQECVAFCAKKRQDSGAAWNGLDWDLRGGECFCNENDVGHTKFSNSLHFRIQ